MISKLITWGRTRGEAISRMERALAEYDVAGVQTTIPFCHFVMTHEAFRSGDFSTHFVPQHFDADVLTLDDPEAEQAAALAAVLHQAARAPHLSANGAEASVSHAATNSRWQQRRKR
jgi:propionyl-CoA carboxylase alpha chain